MAKLQTGDTITVSDTGTVDISSIAKVDNITLTGAGTVTGNSGDNTINLFNTGNDTVVFATAAANGSDTINLFETGGDKFNTDFVTTDGNFTFTSAVVNTGAALVATTSGVHEVTGVTAVADMAVTADVINAISNGTITVATNESVLIAVLATDNNTYLYEATDTGDGAIAAGEMSLVSTFISADLATGDII